MFKPLQKILLTFSSLIFSQFSFAVQSGQVVLRFDANDLWTTFGAFVTDATYAPLAIAGNDGYIPLYQKDCEHIHRYFKSLSLNYSYTHDDPSSGKAFSGTLQIQGQTIPVQGKPWEYNWPNQPASYYADPDQLVYTHEYAGSQVIIRDIPEDLKQKSIEAIKIMHLKPITTGVQKIGHQVLASLIFSGPYYAVPQVQCHLFTREFIY